MRADKYPKEWDFCELNAKSKSDMRFHLKNVHTETGSNHKSLDYDFCAYNEISIQAYQGRQHEDGFTCGLCDFKAYSLKTINLHLKICVSYECYMCTIRVYIISQVTQKSQEFPPDLGGKLFHLGESPRSWGIHFFQPLI